MNCLIDFEFFYIMKSKVFKKKPMDIEQAVAIVNAQKVSSI